MNDFQKAIDTITKGNDVESDWNGGSWCGITHHR